MFDLPLFSPTTFLKNLNISLKFFIFIFVSDEDSSVATTEVLSDNSSWLAEQDLVGDSMSFSSDLQITQELEMLSQEVANKGPPQSDLELR